MIKFRRLVQNDMSTAMIWSKSKPEVEFQYGGRLVEFNAMPSQSLMSHCRVLPPGEFNGITPESRTTLRRLKLIHAVNLLLSNTIRYGDARNI